VDSFGVGESYRDYAKQPQISIAKILILNKLVKGCLIAHFIDIFNIAIKFKI